jgi:hypothetical protein
LTNISAYDILRKEEIEVTDARFAITIPMGTMRIVDLISYPIADAGNDIYIDNIPVDSVVFYGKALDDEEIAKWKWSQLSGTPCNLIDDTTETLIIKNPGEGEYVFRLTVTDDSGITDSDDVNLKVLCELCHTPKVDAGKDRFVYLPKDTVRFNASVETGDEIPSYNWEKINGTEINMSGVNSLNLTLNNLIPGDYSFRFTAVNEFGLSDSDTVNLSLFSSIDTIRKSSGQVFIDGIKEDFWCGKILPVSKIMKGWTGVDASAAFLWDDNFLYVLVEAADAYKIADSGDEWWEDDAVELFIAIDNSKKSNFDDNDFHFGFRIYDTQVYELIHNSTQNVEFKYNTYSKGYSLEIAIPWETLSTSDPGPGDIGVEVIIRNDDDGLLAESALALFGLNGNEEITPEYLGVMTMDGYCPGLNMGLSTIGRNSVVYPTITKDFVNIKMNSNEKMTCNIVNMHGTEMMNDIFRDEIIVDISEYPAGAYIIRLYNEFQMNIEKLIKL